MCDDGAYEGYPVPGSSGVIFFIANRLENSQNSVVVIVPRVAVSPRNSRKAHQRESRA